MSGTSLDGLDLCAVNFSEDRSNPSYKILSCETIPFPSALKDQLQKALYASALELLLLHNDYGSWMGSQCQTFIERHSLAIDLVASHGYTVFHQPQNKLTFQLGSGASLAAAVNLPVVCDFRSMDVARAGQGAPLVPYGEKLLFPEHSHFLNLGGIANITFMEMDAIKAFDVTACNLVLNEICHIHFQKEYDEDGALAKEGDIDLQLLEKMDRFPFLHQPSPKSLGREEVEPFFFPLIRTYKGKGEDLLATFCIHLAQSIHSALPPSSQKASMMVTGGGAYHQFLMQEIKHLLPGTFLPDKNLVEFKESLIFAYLGFLRFLQQKNIDRQVTGADRDSISGCIYLG